ncbi:uncharacterized protein EV154DRAFT_76778 [Mucor mucedo]|uniref:uncharacterized protein n=1 Tax=Mucor mucedo TaxID=29922 RepID=UPI0022206081|nr:uncharacterized protein EV154DRAFT_76778 [Mucor mucedo]KAI7875549.1 hypothetical protein EV154DRAFT_76778 [Mucor mucedo]
MYDDMGNKVKFWGQEAKSRARVRKENNLLENFKLYLSLSQAKLDKESAGILLDVYNNPDNEIILEDVISDYLKLFYRHILNFVGEVDKTNLAMRLLKSEKKPKTKYVMTVPAIWNTVTRQIVMNAAFQANIVKKHDEIIVITELEAAALYCRNQTQELKNGNVTFIVCDAGGGTVDVGTFHLSSTRYMTQLGDCQSDTCGSFYLDANFRTFILQFYKDIGVHFDPAISKFDEFMDRFVNRIKVDFMPDTTNDSYYDIELPGSYVIAESVKTEQNKNYILADSNRTLRIKNEVMDNRVFNPVMERIEALLDKQMKRCKVRFLFLVGGFAQSKYLQQRLRTRYEPAVLLIVPLESMSAVSLGAVHYALKPDILAS